ncbi:hypothetical protein CWC05_04755 [Pseudoalteromonas ruthenica]|uniref:Flagellar hook-length control protein-like C-terminal domain-containing protein n=1 Tax=Pseudoalteromonas ruthenica TaxID=151081 RepID=A0A5S3Z6X2_9GAMM|nr:flagellar hook-length control protein FliK [Pseudoalteromonas ruthenica]TMP87968.1 hypothetical protein CWC05_04755 [Pseudoalteromonas ruthenica]
MSGPSAPLIHHTQTLSIAGDTQQAKTLTLPTEQPLAVKNVHISADKATMQVQLQGQWRTLEVPLQSAPKGPLPLTIEQGTVQLNAQGQLQLTPSKTLLPLSSAQDIMRLLGAALTNGQGQVVSPTRLALTVQLTDKAALSIPALNASLHLNKSSAEIINAQPSPTSLIVQLVKGKIQAHLPLSGGSQLPLPMSQQKLVAMLLKTPMNLQLLPRPDGKHAQLNLVGGQANKAILTLPINRTVSAQLPTQGLTTSLGGAPTSPALQLKLQLPRIDLHVARPQVIVGSQSTATASSATQQLGDRPVTDNKANTSLWQHAKQQLQSWQQGRSAPSINSLASAQQLLQSTAKPLLSTVLLDTPKRLEPVSLSAFNGAARHNAMGQPLSPGVEVSALLNTLRNQSPLLALTAQMQHTVKATLVSGAARETVSGAQQVLSLPLSKALMAPLIKPYTAQHSLTHHLANLDTLVQNAPKELQQLVNQAFSKMVGPHTPAANTVNQLQAQLQPWSQPVSQYRASVTAQIDTLLLSLLGAQSLQQLPSTMATHSQSALMPLVNLLLAQTPQAPASAAEQILQQLQSAGAQALGGDLAAIKQSMTPQSSAPQLTTQQDSNPLVQLFLPMRLPPEAGQTQLSIGRYKEKSQQGKGEDVWFVRMQFDYPKLGELSVQAHLCKQTLNCELRASSQALHHLANEHSETLRRKLQSHGLGVAPIKVEQVSEQQVQQWRQFYRRHSIVNLKV